MNVKDVQQNVSWERKADQAVQAAMSLRRAEKTETRIDQAAAGATADASFESFFCRATHWRVRPGWREVLFGPDGLQLGQWLAANQACIVKSRSHRTVYRVDLPQGSFYVKEYLSNTRRDVLRDLLRGNRALREWRRMLAVRRRGIATVTALAVGVPRRPHRAARAWLITAAEIAQPLDHYLEQILPAMLPAERTRARQSLARQLARFVASLHQAGITHRDLHPGNVLIEQPPPPCAAQAPRQLSDVPSKKTANEPCPSNRFLLVDLQAVSVRTAAAAWRGTDEAAAAGPPARVPLHWRRTRRDLVTVNLYFSQRATRADRRRFLRHYLECRPGLVADPQRTARELEEQTARAACRFWRSRDRRCIRKGRYFYRRTRDGARAFAVRDLPEAALEALLNRPDAPFDMPDAQILKRSSGSQVARFQLTNGPGGIPCVYKRWQPRSARAILLSRLRTSKAMHAWRMGHALLGRGIATPRPLAVIEQSSPARGLCGYLLWEEIDDARHLHGAAEQLGALPPAARHRAVRGIAGRLARLLRRLHDAGFDHRDLKAANFLVQGRPETPQSIYLLDLDAVHRRRCIGGRRRLRDLARLLVSFYRSATLTRTDKLRFFADYLFGGLDDHGNWKGRCRHMDRLAKRKIRRNQRRGRVVA